MSDIESSPEISDAFTAPEANLANTNETKPILQFERFSAWWVFLLSMVTLSIYPVYWLYSRTSKANEFSIEHKVSSLKLNIYVALVIAYWGISFSGAFIGEDAGMAWGLLSIFISVGYIIFYIIIAFGARRALREIINSGSEDPVLLKGILSGLGTFFMPAIYLQYKINEAIDNQNQ